jgi:4-deoxy-L-threo-5-hexosulose-uronate ketol-isomerase
MYDKMYDKIYHSTHPDMMEGASNDQLRDRYLVSGLFQPGKVSLNYSHNERMIIGGATPTSGALSLPTHSEPPSLEGKPFLHARELGVVNIGTYRPSRNARAMVSPSTAKPSPWRSATACTCRWARARSRSPRPIRPTPRNST